MSLKTQKSLFIFRRDLRLQDNAALIEALQASKAVIPCFILDPRQIGNQPYKSDACVHFMIESLLDLERQLKSKGAKLYLFHGMAQDVLKQLIKEEKIGAVYVNEDYTPFSRKRDQMMTQVCKEAAIELRSFHDYVLNPPHSVKKDDGSVYTIYTPYSRKAMTMEVSKPKANTKTNYYKEKIKCEDRDLFVKLVASMKGKGLYPGGRDACLDILKSIKQFRNYEEERNIPHLQATTKLSPHNKFGTCSIREVYHAIRAAFGPDHTLIRELYWRDFFTQIGFHFPHVLGKSFQAKYEGIRWDNNKGLFRAWCEGKTGFPIVDAGMRELNASGFMHNRVRMIVASFLVKDLHIDWQWGEKYFASKLVDYDPLINNGNWQWAASTGCDAQPYFRIFNPWLQQEKFDPEALYIKKWVPELQCATPRDLHQIAQKGFTFKSYPSPIVWHEAEKAHALKAYQSVS